MKNYIDIFAEDEGEDRPKGENSRIAELQIWIEHRYGDIVENARKDELYGSDEKPSVNYEAS